MTDNKYRFGLDWLNGVLPIQDVDDLFKELNKFSSKLRFERWELTNSGKYNYSRRYCLDGKASIQLMYNPVSAEEEFTASQPDETKPGYHNNSGVFFSISGDGIRYLHSIGGEQTALNKLLYYFYHNSFRSSRFDVYCDILDEDNTIVPLIQEAWSFAGREQVGQPFIKTRLRRDGSALRKNFKIHTMLDDNGNEFTNCSLGHHGSTVGMFRCYNKLVEVSDSRLSEVSESIYSSYDVDGYWYRLEYEMHKDNAASCFDSMMIFAEENNNILTFEDIFASAFNKVFSIIVPSCRCEMAGNNMSRADEASSWSDFRNTQLANTIHFVEFKPVPYIPASLKRLDKNMDRLKSYLYICILRLLSLESSERRQFFYDASDSFMNKKRYNSLRDEFDELKADNQVIFNHLENFIKYSYIA